MPPSLASGPVLRCVRVLGPLGLLVAAGVSPAHADRFAIGASVGAGESEGGTSFQATQITTRGVFARLGLFAGVSIEAELGRAELEYGDSREDVPHAAIDGKLGTLTARLDLRSSGALRPHLLAGAGLENWSAENVDWSYGRFELGGGVDLDVAGGLRLGLDLRAGRRTRIDTRIDDVIRPQVIGGEDGPFDGDDGEFVHLRATLGAAF